MAAEQKINGLKRQSDDAVGENADIKKFKGVENESFSTLPYRDLPYADQLQKKQEEVHQTFGAFAKSFKRRYPQYAQWYDEVFLPTRFRIDNIHKSPKTLAYRNKCELSIGYNPEQGKLCAGPRIANGEDGKVQVGPCDKETLIHLPPAMIDIAQDFANFLDKWNYLEEKCPWYNLFIRSTKSGDHMLIMMVRDDGLDVLKERKNELVKYYTEDYTLTHKIVSIFFQPRPEVCEKKAFEMDFLHAHGKEFLVEKVLDLNLIVTPSIYFRINTFAAEVLYQKTLDCADLKKRFTVVLDLWCGCGELSLLAAKKALHVIAIDPSKWNIRKAQHMAKFNKIQNIEFIIAKPEEGLKQVWAQLPTAQELVVIADPPTLCKMNMLADMVAEMSNLKRFIYIYSSHKLHFIKNLLSLTEASILPTRVIPVDVAPHHVRVELIASATKVDPNDPPASALPPPPLLDAALPSTDIIEQIERRAFAMGMAKAMEASGGPITPARAAIPSILDADLGYTRRPAVPEPEYGAGRGFGAGRYGGAGGYEPEYPTGGGFGGARGNRYNDYDDEEPPARFAGNAGRGGKNLIGVRNRVENAAGGRGKSGYRTGGFGSASGGASKFGGGFGAGGGDYDDYSGYQGGYGEGFGRDGAGFGSGAKRGSFGSSGYGKAESSFADGPGGFGARAGGYSAREGGGFGGRGGAGGSYGGFGGRGGAGGGFGGRASGGFGAKGGGGGFGARGGAGGGFGGRGGRARR